MQTPPPIPSTTLTLPSHSLIALAHSDCFKGGAFPATPAAMQFQSSSIPTCLRIGSPTGRLGTKLGFGQEGAEGPEERAQAGKVPRCGVGPEEGVCSRGTLSPNRWGDRGLGSQLSWAAPSSRGGREKEPQSRWGKERDGPGEVVEAKTVLGDWGGGPGQGCRRGSGRSPKGKGCVKPLGRVPRPKGSSSSPSPLSPCSSH